MAKTKKSGRYELSCGHEVVAALDLDKRHRCPVCNRDGIVVRIIR